MMKIAWSHRVPETKEENISYKEKSKEVNVKNDKKYVHKLAD